MMKLRELTLITDDALICFVEIFTIGSKPQDDAHNDQFVDTNTIQS